MFCASRRPNEQRRERARFRTERAFRERALIVVQSVSSPGNHFNEPAELRAGDHREDDGVDPQHF
jgi:hypothetical protein